LPPISCLALVCCVTQLAGVAYAPPADQEYFQLLLETELAQLEAFNCARYRITIGKTEQWIAKRRLA